MLIHTSLWVDDRRAVFESLESARRRKARHFSEFSNPPSAEREWNPVGHATVGKQPNPLPRAVEEDSKLLGRPWNFHQPKIYVAQKPRGHCMRRAVQKDCRIQSMDAPFFKTHFGMCFVQRDKKRQRKTLSSLFTVQNDVLLFGRVSETRLASAQTAVQRACGSSYKIVWRLVNFVFFLESQTRPPKPPPRAKKKTINILAHIFGFPMIKCYLVCWFILLCCFGVCLTMGILRNNQPWGAVLQFLAGVLGTLVLLMGGDLCCLCFCKFKESNQNKESSLYSVVLNV